MLEREIKLRFESADLARQQVLSPAVGATTLRGRRLQQECLRDTDDNQQRQRRAAVRGRSE
jgi:hypothetical protein